MKTEDEILVNSFLKAQVKEIPDAGFSRRVMRRIPNRASRYNSWWQIFCTLVFAVLFTLLNGFGVAWQLLKEFVEHAPQLIAFTPQTVMTVLALVAVGCWHLYLEAKA